MPRRDHVRRAERALDRLDLVVQADGEATVGEVRAERLAKGVGVGVGFALPLTLILALAPSLTLTLTLTLTLLPNPDLAEGEHLERVQVAVARERVDLPQGQG